MISLILRAATRFMLPLLLLFSVFLLIRGHHHPGGGFSGGLVATAAFMLYSFAFGVADLRRALPLDPRVLMGVGLSTALTSGLSALAVGQPFLTGLWQEMPVPGFGKVHLGTPLLFDLGVYLVVIGSSLSIMLPLAEE